MRAKLIAVSVLTLAVLLGGFTTSAQAGTPEAGRQFTAAGGSAVPGSGGNNGNG